MSELQSLKSATSLHDIATLLQFKPAALAFILYIKSPQAKYHSFQIRKRGGGARQISAPSPDLKLVQRHLSDLLQNCMEEINQAQDRKDQLAHGFKRHRSIITNAAQHRKRRYVLNIDLQDFFGTVNFGRVRGFFLKDRNFALHPDAATVLAQIACHENSLPQGSPCSPVITNLIGNVLDIHLGKLAFQTGCKYSRYADDLTFSTNKSEFPHSIAKPIDGERHKWVVGEKLQEIVTRTGFAINQQKTRMQYRTSRQDVTGLVVNSKVNIRSEYRRTVRAMAYRLFMTGHFEFIQTVPDANGVLVPTKKEGTLAQLHGMLGHIDGVDRYNVNLMALARGGNESNARGIGSKEALYRRFLLFKEFYAAPAPVIVCEGKTDNVYVLHAIQSLAANYPDLATVSPQKEVTLSVRIFKYPGTSTGRILRLRGGTGDLNGFITYYKREVNKFKAPGQHHPVILLVDNDEGTKSIFSTVQQITKTRPTGKESFTRIAGSLYLIAMPPREGQKETAIEHAFSKLIRDTIIGGKSLSLDNEFDAERYYGKSVFSKYVEQNAGKIDFSGFTEILTRLAAVINNHRNAAAQHE